jgi:hypothetical protein
MDWLFINAHESTPPIGGLLAKRPIGKRFRIDAGRDIAMESDSISSSISLSLESTLMIMTTVFWFGSRLIHRF